MSEICERLHLFCNQLKIFSFPFDPNALPKNGFYVQFEKGEDAHGANRIVHVGTHNGINRLCLRLLEHYDRENKDRSIFRKNIGSALLNRDGDDFLDQWNLDLTTRAAKEAYWDKVDHLKQRQVEKRVSEYMQNNFFFVAFRVDDKHSRLYWESRLISTVSLCRDCKPSQNWLGSSSPKPKIRESGLWLENELYRQPLLEGECSDLEACGW